MHSVQPFQLVFIYYSFVFSSFITSATSSQHPFASRGIVNVFFSSVLLPLHSVQLFQLAFIHYHILQFCLFLLNHISNSITASFHQQRYCQCILITCTFTAAFCSANSVYVPILQICPFYFYHISNLITASFHQQRYCQRNLLPCSFTAAFCLTNII